MVITAQIISVWLFTEILGRAYLGALGSPQLSPITQDLVEKRAIKLKVGRIVLPPLSRAQLERIKEREKIILDEGSEIVFESERKIKVKKALMYARFSAPATVEIEGEKKNFLLQIESGEILLWTTPDGNFVWCFSCKGKVLSHEEEAELESKYLYLMKDKVTYSAGGKEFDKVVLKLVRALESERFLERPDMPPKSYPKVQIPPEKIKQYPKDIRAFWEKFRERSRARGEIPCTILLEQGRECVR